MKRIALISEHASPFSILGGADGGGQNVYVSQLAKHLAKLGYQVDIFTRRDHPLLPEVAEWAEQVRIVHVPVGPAMQIRKEDLLPYMDEFTVCVLRYCEQQPYDLIHANFWMSGLVAANVKRELGIPFVITFHALGRVRRFYQGQADEFPDERFAIEDRIVQEADHIIAECPQDEIDLTDLYNADSSKITLIPCGFDSVEFAPLNKALARIALGWLPDDRIILQLGRMVPRKGVDTAIRGFAQLVNQFNIAARLVVVGGESDQPDPQKSPELGRLQAIAQETGVGDRVLFVGRKGREMLRYYYSAADVFVTTPWYEPFGITPIEAMACGTPVIGSNVGGIKFTVKDGETGYLVPPNDAGAIAQHIAHLYQHPELLERLSRQAIARANELFTWQGVTNAVANVYETIFAQQFVSTSQVDAFLLVHQCFDQALTVLQESQRRLPQAILAVAQVLRDCFAADGKLLICGNGGSAADAQHLAAEFVGRFRQADRCGLPALALTADTAVLTAWSNDVGYEQVFARQVEAFGRSGDVLLAISTSGRSRNLIHAFNTARRQGLRCIAIVGGDGGDLRPLADLTIVVPSTDPQHIQEVQIVVLHLLCELVEKWLVEASGESYTPKSENPEQTLPIRIQETEIMMGKAIAPLQS
jgi:D-inositol-3-phosphate glycosyltransferase